MRTISLAIAATLFSALPALAQSSTTVIEHRDPPPSGVVIEEHKAPTAVIEHRTTETTGSVRECESTSVKKEGVLGDSKEVTKKTCN
ncbi:hypothetical protein NK718_15330 [Alsobacter sp. SYSU M60028]|uniref:Uncharacterized protein n=1 Tax=Alsobacter ponti TaxID=2962936 RepID=A0ABT1LEG5_9HYPH|nr:hypothetical protein [Alsobacter ponti]MCP8939900.1 hypothetical protein [Alsobacter ponti]